MTDFTRQLLEWYRHSGRHDLPWKQDVNPYRVWVSEIMLQQTQVKTVLPYYQAFMARYPDLQDLAAAPLDDVLHLWSGLGYYSRARNLHRAAQVLATQYGGEFPRDLDSLMALPGIGRSTAGAILALAMGQHAVILDGNVKRVLSRYHAILEWPGERRTEQRLWELASAHTSTRAPAEYTQAIMDLGATVCTRSHPACSRCPVQAGCQAWGQGMQTELPRKKPGKQLPVRQTQFIMIENAAGEVLLQRRPPAGIWGGLWSFPECAKGIEVGAWVLDTLGLQIEPISQEKTLRHTFSHFRLDIQPVRARLVSHENRIREPEDLYWFQPAGDNIRIGMATPVRKLVSTYFTTDAG